MSSPTAFTTIQAALKAAMLVAPALAGGRISSNKARPVPAGQNTAIVLRLDLSDGDEHVLGSLGWQTTYVVECYARAAAGTDPSDAVDALLGDTWARLAALDFTELGASITVSPKIDWQYDDVDTPICCAVIHLTAQHTTDLFTLQPRS